MTIRIFSFIAIFLIYGLSFFQQERLFQKTLHQLPFPLPARIQKVVLGGFLRQLGAEMLYIKTAVFLGGREAGRDPESYASSLAQRFSVISRLHPEFIDTYYLCESSLSYIDPEYTRKANRVLERGMAALPDNWILPFFLGFNHFYYLNEPKEAAMILKPASQLPSAPPWLGHLASVLAAEGGDIYAGLIWLKAMLATEENKYLRKRYREDIAIFEQALSILRATFEYRNRYNQPPPTLEDLVPEFLPHIPQLDGRYVLSWTPPTLRLLRSNPKQQPAKK